MKRHRSKLKKFIDYFSYCFIMFTAIVFIMAIFGNGQPGEAYIGDFGAKSFNTGWKAVNEATGFSSDDFTLPGVVPAKEGDTVVISNVLPDDIEGPSTIVFRTMMEDLYIYVDGELRETYTSEELVRVGYYIPSAYVACDIDASDAGKTIEARFVIKNTGTIEGVKIGAGNNAWFDIIRNNLFLAICALMILIVGLFVIFFYEFASARFKIDRSFFYMGLFMCSISMWMLAESRIRQIIFASPSLSNFFSYFAIEITGVFVCSYFDEIQSRVYHKLYLICEGVITAQIMINMILNAADIAELFQTVFISYVWFAIGIILVMTTLIRDIIKKRIREYIASFIGTCIFLVCCLMEIVSFFTADIWSFGIYICMGLLALLVATIVQTALRTEKTNIHREREKEESLMNTIEAITGAIDAKDEYTGGHSDRVGNYAGMIAREMAADYDFSEEDILRIQYIGFMHDIGKIGVADSVLNKAGRLSDEEFTLMKKHVEIGYDLLRSMDNSIEGLLEGVRHHHERFDGKGYPDGLEGTDIPLVARIICVADCYDAMTSNRVYRKRLSDEDVIAEIKRCAGTQFDPAIAEIFVKMIERGDFKAATIDGMEASELGSVYRSSMLEKRLQSDLLEKPGLVHQASHVRMICYIMKLAEKNKRNFEIFFAGIKCPDCGAEEPHVHEEEIEENGAHEHCEDLLSEFNAYVKKQLTMRDVMIEYDDLCNIVVLFDRTPEELAEIRGYITEFEDAEAYIKEL